MSRYIDADKVLKELHLNHKDVIYIDKNDTAKRIKKIQGIDIVRCNECEWLKVHNTKELYAECRKWHIRFYPFDEDTRTHGCSWGEREGE